MNIKELSKECGYGLKRVLMRGFDFFSLHFDAP
jgi:hypothetical protein